MESTNFMLLEGDDHLVDDRAFTHGLGVFETMLIVDGGIVDLSLHLDRLDEGCASLGIEPPDRDTLLHSLRGTLHPNWLGRAKLMRTSGKGALNRLEGTGQRTLLWISDHPGFPESLTVGTSPWARNERSPIAGVKCTSYAENLLALDYATKELGVDELIFPNTKGEWCEGTTSNLFAVMDGELRTPPLSSGCLPGTARRRVMVMAEELRMPVKEAAIPLDGVRQADEIFLTSAIRGVVPVSEWDARKLPDDRIGKRLRRAWEVHVSL